MKYLILLLLLTSCSGIVQKHKVELKIKDKSMSRYRHVRYQNCVLELNREGVKQDLLKILCDSAHGERK